MADPRSFAREQADFNPNVGMRPTAPTTGLNFVPPPRSTGLDDGLKALASLEPAIDGFLDKQAKELSEKDLKAGREAALKEATEYSEAVRSGKLAPNQSKWFMKGYKAQYGELLGQQWTQEAKVAWESSDAKNSDRPDAASNFISDFVKTKLGSAAGLDPDVREGLLPQMANMRSTMMAAQAAYSAEQVKQKNLEVVGSLITSDIEQYRAGKMSVEQLMANIQERDRFAKMQGVPHDDFNKSVVEAVISAARTANDRRLLDLAKKYPFIGNNPKYQGPLRAADDAIVTKTAALESLAWTRMQREIHERSRNGVINVYAALAQMKIDGKEPEVTPEMTKYLLSTGDPDALTKAYSLAKSFKAEMQQDKPTDINEAYKRIFAAGPSAQAELDHMIYDVKMIKDPSNITALHAIVRSVSQITNDDFFNKPVERIKVLGLAGETGKPLIDPRAVDDAVLSYQREYAQWRMANPKATEEQRRDFSDRLETSIMRNLDKYKKVKTDTYDGKAGVLQSLPTPELSKERDELLKQLQQQQNPSRK